MDGDPGSARDLTTLVDGWHRDVRRLAAELDAAPRFAGTMATEDLDARSAAVRRLRAAFVARETLKQRYLWPLIREHVARGGELVHALADTKRTAEETMIEVRWIDERSTLVEEVLDRVTEQVRAHLDNENRAMLRVTAQVPPEAQARAARELARPRRLVPVQPHPDLPAVPWLVAAVTPVLGAVDRLRDLLSTAPA